MMMSKPATTQEEEPQAPAFATPTPAISAVQDLERKLAMIGTEEEQTAPAAAPAAVAVAPPPQEDSKQPAAVKGGKNALLVSLNFFFKSKSFQKKFSNFFIFYK